MNIGHLEKFNKFILLVWVSILIVFTTELADSASIQEAFALSLAILMAFYPFTTYLSKNLLRKVIADKRVLRFAFLFLLISFLMIFVMLGMYYIFSYLEKIHLFSKSHIFDDIDRSMRGSVGDFAAVVLINFGFCGLRFFEENLKLHKSIIDSQLQTLKAQINPHFMFNVLNHVHVLIKKEPDLASDLLVQYTGILRYQLYSGEKDLIHIRQEVNFLKDFIEIEKIRWKNSLVVEYSWEIEDPEAKFPPLLLITFVENAFKHVSRSKAEKGYVHISLKQTGKTLRFYVENSKFADGQDKLDRDNLGLGLEIIKRRLDILYPGKYEMDVQLSETVYSSLLKIQL